MKVAQVPTAVLFILTLLQTVIGAAVNVTIEPTTSGMVDVTFKETAVLNLTILSPDLLGVIQLISADSKVVALLEDKVEFTISTNTTLPFSRLVSVYGDFVGRSELRVMHGAIEVYTVVVNVHTPFKQLGTIATIILAIWLVISYVVMAAKVEPKVLLARINPPWSITIGMLCQFIIMPPVAYTLAKIFELEGALAVGLVLVGTCPGGFFSNIEILLLDCDLVLSLAMTTFSTFLAVAMMPLNLFIYAQPFIAEEGRLQTPFRELLIQLVILVLPLLIGVPFFYKFPKARNYCLKLVKPFTAILMLLGVVLFLPSQYYVLFSDWKVWVTSSILTVIGAFLGMSVARIANFNYVTSVTIAIETGFQNTLLAVSVAKLFYIPPESDVVAIIPLLVAIVSAIEGFVIIIIYYVYLFATRKSKIAPAPTDVSASRADEDEDEAREGCRGLESNTSGVKDTEDLVPPEEQNEQSQEFKEIELGAPPS